MGRFNGMRWQDDSIHSWNTHVKLTKEHGKYNGIGRNKRGWSANDTAKHLGISRGKLSEDLRLAKGLKKYGDSMRNITERQDAINWLKGKGEF